MSISPEKSPSLGHRHRLRERFSRTGLNGFAPHEIVELVLVLAIPRHDVKPLAKNLLATFGSLNGILSARADELRAVKGIGDNTVFALHFIRSLIPLYLEKHLLETSLQTKPDALAEFWIARLAHEKAEIFEVAHFDSGLRLLHDGIETHSKGCADRTAVFPGEAMKMALKRNAYAVAFAHNHPSGDSTPSDHDKLLTRQLVLAATAVQVRVVDHLIVSSQGYFSFRERGML